jgi:hypothetical protein
MPDKKVQEEAVPQMGATSDSDARAMAALGGGPTDPNPQATAQRAKESIDRGILSKAEGTEPPTKPGPAGQETADGSQMSPGPVLNKGKEEEEKEDDKEEEMERSQDSSVDDDELIKALDGALTIARGSSNEPDPDRRAELADKLSKGEITAEEGEELHQLIKSAIPADEQAPEIKPEDELNKSTFTEAVLDDPDIAANHSTADGLDVSGWLARHAAFVGGSLDKINSDLSDQMSKSFDAMSRFNLALAKANRVLGKRVIEQGELIKSLTGRLETVEETPLPRAGITGAAALNKSLPASNNSDELPSRADIVRGLTSLNKSSADGNAPCGMDITEAVTRFESTGQIRPEMLADVKKVL